MRRLLPALALLTGCAHGPSPLLPPIAPSPLVQSPAPVQDQPAAPQKSWRDTAEFELANAAVGTADPSARLVDLDKWTANYPATEYIDVRLSMYLAAYTQLNQARQAFDTARKILQTHPYDFQALIATVSQAAAIKPAPTPADLDVAEKAGNFLLNNLDTVLSAANKPPGTSDANWAVAKEQIKPFVERALIAIRGLR